MRIAVLWTQLSGYLNACLKELVRSGDSELFVAYMAPTGDAPFDESEFAWIANRYRYTQQPDKDALLGMLKEFHPEVIYGGAWQVGAYRVALQHFRTKAVRILCIDTQWRGTIKQRIGCRVSPFYIKPLYDGIHVAGERQADFAHRLGYQEGQIVRGMYTCDQPRFEQIFDMNHRARSIPPKRFVFAGRLSREKGVRILVEAYLEYRRTNSAPWELHCYGAGNLESEIRDINGLIPHGFVQPDDLPKVLSESSCFVLPSLYEPWGVVIHEATAAGLAIICSTACGASVHLVQDGFNGFLVEPGDPQELAYAMACYSDLSDDKRREMSENSHLLSLQFTPRRWASSLVEHIQKLRSRISA